MTCSLVTGAAGFIGANLVRRLAHDGHDVHSVTGPGTNTWRLDGLDLPRHVTDLTDSSAVDVLLAEVRPDWIFHLAAHGAYSWQVDTRRIVAVDVGGAANLLESSLAVGFDAFVNAGSSSEYGVKTAAPSEDEALDPNSVYAAAKAAATMLLRHASIAHDVPITTLRLYSAYGAWEDPRRLIPSLVTCGLEGELPPLVGPSVARDFVYIDDVVDAFVRTAEASLTRGAVINIASGVQTSLADAVEVTRRVFGITTEPSWGSLPPRTWDTSTWVGEPRRAREQLGWQATHSFEDGFRATVDWAREGRWSRVALSIENRADVRE
jgi:UDP-glucose 4-epimerase